MTDLVTIVGLVVTSVVGLGGMWLKYRELPGGGAAAQTKASLEIFNALPEGSDVRDELLKDIEDSVRSMIENRTVRQRNPLNVAIALVIMTPSSLLSWYAWEEQGFLLAILPFSIFVLLVGLFGLVDGLSKSERDAKGNRVRENGADEK